MPLSPEAQTLADSFTAGLSADQSTNFNDALRNSPALVEQINAAVASGDLRGFSLLPPGTNAGGEYDPTARTMQLPESIMTTPTTPAGAAFDPGELTFVMGHEVQHAINRPTTETALDTFAGEVNRIGESEQAVHDYTQPLSTMLAANRNDEATANIAGYNATVDMLRSQNGGRDPSLAEIYESNTRMEDVIGYTPGNTPPHALLPGYTLNADMSMTADPANIEAMGQRYYDKPANMTGLGPNADSDYQNYYASNLVGYIAEVERYNAPTHAANGVDPQMHLDMNALGINEAQLERNGMDLGAPGASQTYYDTSTDPPTQGTFDHTVAVNPQAPGNGLGGQRTGQDTGQDRVLENAQGGPGPRLGTETPEEGRVLENAHGAPGPRLGTETPEGRVLENGAGQPTRSDPDSPEGGNHMNHPLLQRAMEALDRSPNIPPDAFGEDRLRVAAGVALHAASQDVRPDHIVFNDRRSDLFAVQGELSEPTSRVSTPLPVAQALAADIPSAQRTLDGLQQVPVAGRDLPAQQQDNPLQEPARPAR